MTTIGKIRALAEHSIAAMGGGLIALVLNALLFGGDSALFRIAADIDAIARFRIAPLVSKSYALALLVSISGLSIFYMRPLSVKGAFASGVLAVALVGFFVP